MTSAKSTVLAFQLIAQTTTLITEKARDAVNSHRQSLAEKFIKDNPAYSGFWYKSFRFQPETHKIPTNTTKRGRVMALPLYTGETPYTKEAEFIVKDYEDIVNHETYINQTMNMLTAGLEKAQDVRNALPDIYVKYTPLKNIPRTKELPNPIFNEPVKDEMVEKAEKLIHYYAASHLIL